MYNVIVTNHSIIILFLIFFLPTFFLPSLPPLSPQDLSHSLLPVVADSILNGLRDQEDDVRTVAATSLLPVADKLYTILRDKVCTCMYIVNVYIIIIEHVHMYFNVKYMYMYTVHVYACICMTLVFAIRLYTCTQCTCNYETFIF